MSAQALWLTLHRCSVAVHALGVTTVGPEMRLAVEDFRIVCGKSRLLDRASLAPGDTGGFESLCSTFGDEFCHPALSVFEEQFYVSFLLQDVSSRWGRDPFNVDVKRVNYFTSNQGNRIA
jgi:hypothetical protein